MTGVVAGLRGVLHSKTRTARPPSALRVAEQREGLGDPCRGLRREMAQERAELFGMPQDGRLEVAGDLPAHGEERIRVLAEAEGDLHDQLLGGRGEDAALDLRQIGGLDLEFEGEAPERQRLPRRLPGFAELADVR